MTACMRPEELVFAMTHTQTPIRTILVPNEEMEMLSSDEIDPSAGCYDFSDAPIDVNHEEMEMLSSDEINPAAGCYDFSDAPFNVNRFIIWRSVRTSLLLEERSVRHSLKNNTLCLNFASVNVIPGTGFFYVNQKLVLIVPTQNMLHRFAFDAKFLEQGINQE
uniref:Polyprotein n=1 Tax=Gongylonema pulchrum TaxID=637853 RepID=A0A183ELB8_9BILA|nr:unnamed protein product [Gongylonema pulchrum]